MILEFLPCDVLDQSIIPAGEHIHFHHMKVGHGYGQHFFQAAKARSKGKSENILL